MNENPDIPLTPKSSWPLARGLIVLALMGGTLAMSIYYYPLVPDVMPIHFDLRGRPNGFASKNTALFLGSVCQVIMAIILGLAHHALARPEQDRASKYFSAWKGISVEVQAALMPKIVAMLDGCLFSLLLMFAYLEYMTIMISLSKIQRLENVWLFVAFIVVWCAYYSIALYLTARRFKDSTPIP